jgi:hypothetical protein
LPDLPFHSIYVAAIAWHPDGRRLAVAEGAGAQSLLTSIALADMQPRTHATLPMRAGRNWQAIPAREWMIGDNDQGQLVARLLDGSFVQVYFEGPVLSNFWSLSEDGQQLLYVRRSQATTSEIRLHNFDTGQDFVLVDSLSLVRGFKILPDAGGFIVSQSIVRADSIRHILHYFNLPERTVHKTFILRTRDAFFSPSKDNGRLAFVRGHASFNSPDSLMILDLQTEKVAKFPLQGRPFSELVWMEDDQHLALWEWQSGFRDQEGERMYLRVYSTSAPTSQLLAQRPTFGYYYSSELFAIRDALFYLSPAPPRVCLFDLKMYSCEELLQMPTHHRIDGLAWTAQGEKLFLHAQDENGPSEFYLFGPAQLEHHRKPYSVSSASLLPDKQHFIGVMNQRLVRGAIASSTLEPLLPDVPCTAASVHPSGTHMAAFGLQRPELQGVSVQPMFLIDLKQNVIVDSLVLPYSDRNELHWLLEDKDQKNFSAIWRREIRGFSPVEYYHLSFGLPLVSSIYSDNWISDFAIFPANSYLTLLHGNQILLTQWRIEVP